VIKVSAAKGRAGGKGAKGAAAPATVKVTFSLPLAEAPEPVSVCGDFNGWDHAAHKLVKRANGTRSVSVDLAPGRYAFKYLTTNGTWFTDPEAHGHEANEYGETNSILEV
jgi:1,4-alpha-glucan branching enzyme